MAPNQLILVLLTLAAFVHGRVLNLFYSSLFLKQFPGQGEQLVWSDEFDFLDETKWQHFVTGWDGGNDEFQYYRNNRTNSYVKNGLLYILPTLTADQYGEQFIYDGSIDLTGEGCMDDMNIENGCMM